VPRLVRRATRGAGGRLPGGVRRGLPQPDALPRRRPAVDLDLPDRRPVRVAGRAPPARAHDAFEHAAARTAASAGARCLGADRAAAHAGRADREAFAEEETGPGAVRDRRPSDRGSRPDRGVPREHRLVAPSLRARRADGDGPQAAQDEGRRRPGGQRVTNRAWPDGNDPIAAELRRALDEAQQRLPDNVTVRRGWAAFDARPAGRRGARLSWFAGGMASTAALALASAALLWPRVVQTPERSHLAQAPVASPASAETRRLTLEGGVEAELQRTSVMRLEGSGPRVEDGAVRFKVPHRRPGHPFVVRAERYRVIVLGTKFGVAVNGAGDRRVDVDVDEGVVEVWNNDVRLARLEPGQRWNSTPAESAPADRDGTEKSRDAADKVNEKYELPVMAPAKAPPSPVVETSLRLRSETRHRRSSMHT